jgi:pantetheine-phosphate adenylyltransferase
MDYYGPMSYGRDGSPLSAHAVYPGTFDPFTAGHLDIVDRARRLVDHLTILVAINSVKRPLDTEPTRAAEIEAALPRVCDNVSIAVWTGLTAAYCRHHEIGVIVRGVRNTTDLLHEYQLAAMNQELGVTTLLLPARPALMAVSSTAIRSLQTWC